jgi:glycosyltransferase involved in cell wall biosynthesis
MHVLIVTQYFWPENFKSNDIAFELVKRRYKVDVLTGIPNYPEGRYYKGYGLFKKRYETVNGVKVFRAFQIARGQNNKPRLALNYLSFALFASIWALLLSIFRRYDCIIVHAPSPITQALPAVLISKLQGAPMYLWVLDLWPEAMLSGGNISNSTIYGVVDSIVKMIYNNSSIILVSSEDFNEAISSKGDYRNKIEYFPNWSEDFLLISQEYPIPTIPQGFIIMIAGNLGISQDLNSVLRLAIEMRDCKNIKWVLVGEGSKRKWIEDSIAEHNLQDIMFTLGRYPLEAMPSFFRAATAMLLTLSGEFTDLELVVPARLQSFMSAGRPVLGMINGAGADLIAKSNCGYAVKSGDYISLARIIREKVIPEPEAFENMGSNGRRYFESHFTKDICINHLCEIINKT